MKKFLHSFFVTATCFASILAYAGIAQASVEIHMQGYNSSNGITVGVSSGNNGGTALNVFGNPENTFPLYKNGSNNNQSFNHSTKLTFSGTTVTQSSVGFNYEAAPGSGVTTVTGLNDDTYNDTVINLPFDVNMYGRADNLMLICSNGYIDLNRTSLQATASGACMYYNSDIATGFSGTSDHIIAGAWVDLYPPAGGTVKYWTNGSTPNRVFVVQYDSISPWSSGGGNYFEIKFNESDTAVAPDAPQNLAATPGDLSANLTWDPPLSDGGSGITNYRIIYGENGLCDPTTPTDPTLSHTNCSTLVPDPGATPTSTTITGLSFGTTYIFAAYAQNSIGWSLPSNTTTATPTCNMTNSFCGAVTITNATLSFVNIPASFNFSSVNTNSNVQTVFNNGGANPPAAGGISSDLISVLDTRGDPSLGGIGGGFVVQVNNSTIFTDGTHTIPMNSLSVVTTADSALVPGTVAVNGVMYDDTPNIPVATQTINAPVNAGANALDNPATYSGIPASQFGSGDIVLMDGTLQNTHGRNGTMYNLASYDLNVPANQAPGDYAVILTFTLFDSTT